MEIQDARAAISQSRIDEENAGLVFAETFFISVILGYFVFHSWWVFGASFFGLPFILIISRTFRILFGVTCSACWTLFGYWAGGLFGSLGARVFFAVLLLMVSAGAHASAFIWIFDIGRGRN